VSRGLIEIRERTALFEIETVDRAWSFSTLYSINQDQTVCPR